MEPQHEPDAEPDAEGPAPSPADLTAALEEIRARLARGAADRRSAFHTAQLATAGLDGGPRVRTVVLRGADLGAARLRIHTDRRSPKAAEIAAEPRVELHLYDPRARLQLRLRGLARVEAEGAAADEAWRRSAPGSRVCYRGPFAPGAPLPAPGAADPGPEARAPADPDAGRDRFAAVAIAAERIDALWLAASGHRRALFRREGEGWSGGWIAP
jgi:hypothetical protein